MWEAQSNGEVLLHLLFPIFLNPGMSESRGIAVTERLFFY